MDKGEPMTIEHLTQLQYSTERTGPFALYIYEPNSEFHRGKIWFRNKVKYPREEISTANAKERVDKAMSEKREIRICDGGDMLVFHAVNGIVQYGDTFWQEVGAQEARRG